MTKRLLHFTLGPVQGFVEQARRTSDLWAGSFLLSWLSGQAMKAVEDANGKIVFPKVKGDPLFEAISNSSRRTGPAVGSLPNRFKARVPDDFQPERCREAILRAWRRLADKVWNDFVRPVADQGRDTQEVWDRQIEGFWDLAWVIGADPGDRSDHAWLDRRKNWRSHRPPEEPGDHCMRMGDWQELSGYIRAQEQHKQDEFWRALKGQVEQRNPLDLDDKERLCAIALIKRLFPHAAKDVLGWEPFRDGQPVRWPSTPRLAATGWLLDTWERAPEEAQAFADAAQQTRGGLIEPDLGANPLSRVPGALLRRSGIESARADELGDNPEERRGKLLEAYAKLTKKEAVGEPTSFYALLLMDGDRVGQLLSDKGEGVVSKGLGQFAHKVDATVRKHGGTTVYAGGDDVLALLPVEGALKAALELREAYRDAFADDKMATISAALILAHFHVPLRHVLREAHHRLDDIAKEENGRDSLAICVLSQSGVLRQWAAKWEGSNRQFSPPAELDDFTKAVDADASGRFFYSFETHYRDVLNDLPDADIRRILRAEYRQSGAAERFQDESEKEHATRIDGYVDRLMQLARQHGRPDSARSRTASAISMDGPLIARFLAREGRWP